MLRRIEIELQIDQSERLSFQKAVLLQSVLMENATEYYAEKMHEQGLHPYSIALVSEGNKNIWSINTLNDEAYWHLIEPMKQISTFILKHNNWNVTVKSNNIIEKSENDLLNEYYFSNNSRLITLQFCTPTSFKSDGRYQFYPQIDWIYKSIFSKYDAFVTEQTVYDEELLKQLIENTDIVSYNLKSYNYYIGKASVPAFVGSIKLRIDGPQSLVNFVHYLLHYGEFAGVGVKTGMGMGNIKVKGD